MMYDNQFLISHTKVVISTRQLNVTYRRKANLLRFQRTVIVCYNFYVRDVEAVIFQALPLPLRLTKSEKTIVDNFF